MQQRIETHFEIYIELVRSISEYFQHFVARRRLVTAMIQLDIHLHWRAAINTIECNLSAAVRFSQRDTQIKKRFDCSKNTYFMDNHFNIYSFTSNRRFKNRTSIRKHKSHSIEPPVCNRIEHSELFLEVRHSMLSFK